jgi:tetrahydromethanopterin S-methyltransferase subunit G
LWKVLLAMVSEVEVSLGEVMRRLDELTIEVKQMNLNISQTYLRKDVYESDTERISQAMDHITDRLEKMESRSEWVVRTVGALFIATVVGASMYVGQVLGI